MTKNSFNSKEKLTIGKKEYIYYSLPIATEKLGLDLAKLPYSLKILLENMLRYEDGKTVTVDNIEAFAKWLENASNPQEIAYRPARVLMQDFTGVPAVVDLAAMRTAAAKAGADPELINPLSPVDLVIDHSVQVDKYGSADALAENVVMEMKRNKERYEFLKWGQNAFNNFRAVPPGMGICHQVNLEYLSQVVWTRQENGEIIAYPDTLVGTDSHTTMVNGLGVLGWGVGGIEAEAAMLGQPISMLIPDVVGFELTGELPEGATATDLVLTIVEMLRKVGVVGKFVEFYGVGLKNLSLADRATIANMAPEYGATCGIFPIDEEVIRYMKLSARAEERIELVEEYAKIQQMWGSADNAIFSDKISLNMAEILPSIAGPKRPQDRIELRNAASEFAKISDNGNRTKVENFTVGNGDVVIAAITSCTNTSNPSVMLAAGLVAKKAHKLGLKVKPWVKTSLAPGSQVVSKYLEKAGLQDDLDALGFNIVGYGCTTCIGNSGPLNVPIEAAIKENDFTVCSVLSGNRNFEGRVHALVKANYLASPPLVVAYALAGNLNIDITKDSIGTDKTGNAVYLRDIWPSNAEINDTLAKCLTKEMFAEKYATVFAGNEHWQSVNVKKGKTYEWDKDSTYIRHPSFFEGENNSISNIEDANILAILGDSVTTDHISPAGNIAVDSPAAIYLTEHGVEKDDFNSYGSRRGNHEVMMRGTFANIRIHNEMTPEIEGGYTKYIPSNEKMPIYDAAMKYIADNKNLIVIGGKEYGTGSSRDWAAKGTLLLGVKAVIAESFERIHRSNLVGMGVLPLIFKGDTRKTLGLDGSEIISLTGLETLIPRMNVACKITYANGKNENITLICRLDTEDEIEYYKSGGILRFVMNNLINK